MGILISLLLIGLSLFCWRYRYAFSVHPSWRIVYLEGSGAKGRSSIPLRYEDAKVRANLFGPAKIEYCRDWRGNLI